jgi:hypothetical protein
MVDYSRWVRVGSIENAVGYDVREFDSAIETTEPIAAGDPQEPNHVITLGGVGSAVSDIDNPTELGSKKGKPGQFILVAEIVAAGSDLWTLYAYDDDGPSENAPYVMRALRQDPDALPAGERWVAIAGQYSYIDHLINAKLEVKQLFIEDTNQSNKIEIKWNENDTVDRILNILVAGANRTLSLGANLTVSGSADVSQDMKSSASPTFAGLTLTGKPSETFTVLTAIQAGGSGAKGIQYKSKSLTLTTGIITTSAVESSWTDI